MRPLRSIAGLPRRAGTTTIAAALAAALAFALALAVPGGPVHGAEAAPRKVMIVSWTGCEEACQGVQAHLRERGMDVRFLLRDAAQRKDALPGFVQEARAERVDVIVTYGTSATRGIAGTLAERSQPAFAGGIPKVFMIVADPVGVGLVRSLEAPGRDDLTGTYNRVPERVNIETMRAYRPGFRRLGLLFHDDEPNSVIKRDELAALAGSMGFELVALPLPRGVDGRPQPADIAPQVHKLKAAGVDFVYVGSSSFLRDNADLLTGAANALGLPLLSPYESMVRDGDALLSVAARYEEVGRLAGAQVERILRRRDRLGELPVVRMDRFAVVVNVRVARRIKQFPPIELLQVAETVN
jgi:putative tryptophan/tyrosine transport system substrate-binding protein